MIIVLVLTCWLWYVSRRTNYLFTAACFLSFPYYYFLHSLPLIWLDFNKEAYYTVQAHESIMLASVFLFSFIMSGFLPVFKTFNYQKYSGKIVSFFVVLLFLALVIILSGTFDWIVDPRLAYQHNRSGIGLIYALYTFSLGVFLLCVLTGSKIRLSLIAIVLSLSYFTGSKGIILSSFLSIFICYVNSKKLQGTKLFIVTIFCSIGVVILTYLLILGGFFGQNFLSIFQHFDAFHNSIIFYDEYKVSIFGYAPEHTIEINNRMLSVIQRQLEGPLLSFHFTYFPLQAELGHFKAHLSSTYYLATGYNLFLLPVFAIFLNLGTFIKVLFITFCCRHWNGLEVSMQNMVIIFLVFQPLLKFLIDFQFLIFSLYASIYLMGYRRQKGTNVGKKN